MNNSKFLKIIIVLLLLINLSTISFMWFHKQQRNDAVRDFFTKELQFSAKQKEQFETLKEEHRAQIEALKEENKMNHDTYFDLLKNPNVDSITVANAAHKIIVIKEKEELATFYHFQKIRAICDDNQKQKFDKIINEASRMLAPERPPRGEQGQRPEGRDENGPPPPRM